MKPTITTREVARIRRPSAPNTIASDLVVSISTLAPRGAPVHVRPRFVSLALLGPGREVTIAIRRVELAGVVGALSSALRTLTPEPTYEHGAGI